MTIAAPPDASAPPPPDADGRPGTIEIRGMSKSFPNVQALRDISLDFRPGEVLALMGENGAGKSTLLKILSGDYQPDAGTMTRDGEALSFGGPRDARRAGIRVIYQEPEIIPGIDVAENIYLGELPSRGAVHRPDDGSTSWSPHDLRPLWLRGRRCRRRSWATCSRRRSASWSRSCGPSSRASGCSPSTSPPRRSPTRRSTACSRSCAASSPRAWRSSTSATGSTRSCASPTGSPSCATARWSGSARPAS